MNTPSDPTEPLTLLLNNAARGDTDARDRALAIVHRRLRDLAEAEMAGERRGVTLQPTVLINEAYLKMFGDGAAPESGWSGRDEFLALASVAMRRIAIDYARKRLAKKRGGDKAGKPLDDADAIGIDIDADSLLDLDNALRELERLNERHSRIVELKFFGGLTDEEVASVIGVARRTVQLDWAAARAWLRTRMGEA